MAVGVAEAAAINMLLHILNAAIVAPFMATAAPGLSQDRQMRAAAVWWVSARGCGAKSGNCVWFNTIR